MPLFTYALILLAILAPTIALTILLTKAYYAGQHQDALDKLDEKHYVEIRLMASDQFAKGWEAGRESAERKREIEEELNRKNDPWLNN